jgi:hypothetical protein
MISVGYLKTWQAFSVSVTVYYTISVSGGFISFGLTAIGGVYIILHMRGEHRKQLEKINRLINRIEDEESLPSIIEIERNP